MKNEAFTLKKFMTLIVAIGSLVLFPLSPASANTLCNDGTISMSRGSGTCSWHGGIAGNSKSRNNGFSDPYGSTSRNKGFSDPYGSTSRNKGFSDPYGSSFNNRGLCSYLDRSRGRC